MATRTSKRNMDANTDDFLPKEIVDHHTDEASPAELAPVELDPPDPAIARWQALVDVELVINHDDDAERVIPFPRPVWAQPDEDQVGQSASSSYYSSDYVCVPVSHQRGESRDGRILPSGVRVRGRVCGDGWSYIGVGILRFLDDEWSDLACAMTLDEARKLAEVLLAAVDMVGGDK